MLVEIVVVVLFIGAAVAGVLVYRNNQKKADAVVAKAQCAFDQTKAVVQKTVDDIRKEVKK